MNKSGLPSEYILGIKLLNIVVGLMLILGT